MASWFRWPFFGQGPAPHRSPLPDHLPTLDGWRAVAILAVILHHDRVRLFGPTGLLPNSFLERILLEGQYGVDLFFAISGFLICTRLLRERERTGRICLASFYVRRTFRILPPYLTFLAVLGVITSIGVLALSRWEFVSCVLFFRNYLPNDWAGRDGVFTYHFWSLSVEEHFYLLWPSILIVLGRSRWAPWGAFALGLAIALWRGLDARLDLFMRLTGCPVGSFARTDTRLDGLIFGCWIALLLDVPGAREWLTRAARPVNWFLLLGLFLAVIFFPARFPVFRTWISLLAPLLIVGTVLRPHDPPGRLLEQAPLRWVGRISYSLYLWQQLFMLRDADTTPFLGPLEVFPLNWVALFACALTSYHLIETPMIARGHRLARRLTSPPAPKPSD